MTRRWLANGVALAVLFLFVRGVDPTPLPGGLIVLVEEFLIGLLVGLPTAFALRNFYREEFAVRPSLRSVPYAVRYLAVFIRELITANVDVAYRVLAPSMPIEPDVVAVPLRVESDAAITTIANSITLTPGTLTMDHDAETNTLYVHAINCTDRATVLAPIRTWEDYALVIFEGRDPSTPVPEPGPGQPSADGGRPVTDDDRVAPLDDGGEPSGTRRATSERRSDGGESDGE